MGLYFRKPVPVEAVRYTSARDALGFLRVGEYIMITRSTVTIRLGGSWAKARLGDWLVRESGHLAIFPHEDFRQTFISAETTESANFTAHQDNEGNHVVECDECGPVGVATSPEAFPEIGLQHLLSTHTTED